MHWIAQVGGVKVQSFLEVILNVRLLNLASFTPPNNQEVNYVARANALAFHSILHYLASIYQWHLQEQPMVLFVAARWCKMN